MTRRVTNIPLSYDAQAFRQIIRDIEARLAVLERSVSVYQVSNFAVTRSLDMATATSADIGNFVATLVSDLQQAGRLGS